MTMSNLRNILENFFSNSFLIEQYCKVKSFFVVVSLADENFANPQCSMNKYWLKIGDYRYALSRSLEGSLATSKGIISKSDLFTINLEDLAMSRTHGIIIQASDGLFEVLDNEEVAKNAVAIRKEGLSAQECAKILCQMAVKKNTSDNVSVVVIYLE
jgi:serine/threonine protein phosphatase PrpC